MRQVLGTMGTTTLEHNSSKLVDQMRKVTEEVQQEVEQVMKIFQYFRSKITPNIVLD